jgi:hypothetical protein
MKKVIKILKENSHEYNVLVERTEQGTKYSLYRSDNLNIWISINQYITSILDNGNCIILEKNYQDCNYFELDELMILLNCVKDCFENYDYKPEIVEIWE